MTKEFGGKGYELNRDTEDTIRVAVRRFNCCDTHYHKQIELIFSNSNKFAVEADQQHITLRRGDFLIAHSYCLHKYNEKKFSTVVCVPLKYTNYFNKFQQNGNAYTIIRKSFGAAKIFQALKNLRKYKNNNSYKQDSLFFALLGEILDAKTEPIEHKSLELNDISFKIIEFINVHYKEKINLENLAAHCGYSKNYISTLFNTSFNCNFNEYVNLRRLQAFVELQASENAVGITETAAAVGFNSPRTFFNAFREHYNMTPKEYLALKK